MNISWWKVLHVLTIRQDNKTTQEHCNENVPQKTEEEGTLVQDEALLKCSSLFPIKKKIIVIIVTITNSNSLVNAIR